MELDYRTALRFTSRFDRDAITEFRHLLYEWLRNKRLDADALTVGVTEFSSTTVGTLAHVPQRDGSVIERFRLTEVRSVEAGTQTWQTEILAYQRADGVGEVLVHVNDPRENTPGNRPGPTGVPGFVRLLLDTTEVQDGLMPLANGPRILDDHDEQLVHDLIVDDSRRLPLVLAPVAEGVSVDQFAVDVKDMTHGMAGQAGVFVLGPTLTPLLEDHTGYLWLPPGGMRLVPPGTDPATRASASNSYYVLAPRIAERGVRRVERHWTWLAREYGNTQPWPKHMQRVMHTITRHERDVLLKDLDAFVAARARTRPASTPTTQPVAPVPTEVIPEVITPAPEPVLEPAPEPAVIAPTPIAEPMIEPVTEPDIEPAAAASTITPTQAEEQVREALLAALPNRDILNHILSVGGEASVIESLEWALTLAEDYNALYPQIQSTVSAITSTDSEDTYFEETLVLQEQIQRLEAALEESEARNDREAGAARWLRNQLTKIGHAEAAYSAPQEVNLAQDFDTVLEVIRELEFLAFTGDESITRDLDDMRGSRAAAKKTHRALLALNDYARAKADGAWNSGAFSEYLSDAPAGYTTISKTILAPKEPENVSKNPKFRRYRELLMPNGDEVFMEAHIKLSAEATTSPRLHYYDDTGESRLVIVGYIGAHLPNSQT